MAFQEMRKKKTKSVFESEKYELFKNISGIESSSTPANEKTKSDYQSDRTVGSAEAEEQERQKRCQRSPLFLMPPTSHCSGETSHY